MISCRPLYVTRLQWQCSRYLRKPSHKIELNVTCENVQIGQSRHIKNFSSNQRNICSNIDATNKMGDSEVNDSSNQPKRGKVYAMSDLHVDYKENLEWVSSWHRERYQNDALIVAGDVTDKLSLLETVLRSFCKKFKRVYFCPGNHELWIRPQENCRDSIMKHQRIMSMCERIGVHVEPSKFQLDEDSAVWIVPLQSWYATPEDDRVDSLYMTHPNNTDDIKTSESMWMDNHLCKWPSLHGKSKSKYFASMNEASLAQDYDSPVITFSHMVPRKDLIPPTDEDREQVNRDRRMRGLGPPPPYKPIKGFNFTRYAGSAIIETQLRTIGSKVHIYGHQHRNKDRTIDGVRYVSHCLGNRSEQTGGDTWGVSQWNGPKPVWPLPKTFE